MPTASRCGGRGSGARLPGDGGDPDGSAPPAELVGHLPALELDAGGRAAGPQRDQDRGPGSLRRRGRARQTARPDGLVAIARVADGLLVTEVVLPREDDAERHELIELGRRRAQPVP